MRLSEELISQLRSVSKAHLQKSLGFLWRMIRCLVDDIDGDVMPPTWDKLRALTATEWLQCYDRATAGSPIIGFQNFRKQIYLLQVLHNRVLNPHADVIVPSPTLGGRIGDTEHVSDDNQGGHSSSGCESTISFGSTGSRLVDEDLRRRQRTVRQHLMRIRSRLCPNTTLTATDGHDEERIYAFTAAEVRAILQASITTQEQLIVLLFLTTGLRIGGLCRLRIGSNTVGSAATIRGCDIPQKLSTVEKNGRPRTILLTPACRILVARWLRECHPQRIITNARFASQTQPLTTASATPLPQVVYLFPSPVKVEVPVSTSFVWKLCRGIFRRARVQGSHVHPHTFRHTLIHLMYMGGTTFENIAKFIGHASANVTSAVYGRLRHLEVVGSIQGVPFLANAEAHEETTAWKDVNRNGVFHGMKEETAPPVGRLLSDPWRATHGEWEGLTCPSIPTESPPVSTESLAARKRRLLDETHRAKRCGLYSA